MRSTSDNALAAKSSDWIAPLTAALVVTCLVRGAVLIGVGDVWGTAGTLAQDNDAYRAIAMNLIERGEFSRSALQSAAQPTAFRPPLYPSMLSLLCLGRQVDNLTVAVFHLILGLGTVAVTFALAREWQLGSWSAAAAGMLVGLDPLLLNQSTLVMTETFATFLAACCGLALSFTSRRPGIGTSCLAGLLLGLAVLCRPTFLVWVAFIACVSFFRAGEWKQKLLRTGTLLAGVLLLLTPWVLRNQQQLNKPILATTHGGYTFLLGNNSHFYAFLRDPQGQSVWDADELHATMWAAQAERQQPLPEEHPEVTQDRLCYAEAWSTIQQQPMDFARSCLVRVARLWTPLPHQLRPEESSLRQMTRYVIAAWYSLLFMAVLLGVASHRHELFQNPWVWGITLCLSLTLLHTFFWSNIRMRAPALPFLCCLAVIGAEAGYRHLHARRRRPTE